MTRSPINQRMIERAVRAANKAGFPPSNVECHPDGRIILCFAETKVSTEEVLDLELEQWKRKNAPN